MKKESLLQSCSNNNESRVASFSRHLDIDFIFKARKPMGKAFDKAIT